MAIEIVSFPINSMVDLSIATLNYQRVSDIPITVSYILINFSIIYHHHII